MNLVPIFRFVFSKKKIASQDHSPWWVIIWLMVMTLACLTTLYLTYVGALD